MHVSCDLPHARARLLLSSCGRICASCIPSRNGRCENLSTSETDRARSTTELKLPTRPTQQLELHAINGTARMGRNNTEKWLPLATGRRAGMYRNNCCTTRGLQDTCRLSQDEDSSQFYPLPSFTVIPALNFLQSGYPGCMVYFNNWY